MDVDAIGISAAGMRAQRLRMETAALNLANAETTSFSTEEREGRVAHVPYRRRVVEFGVGADGLPAGRVAEDRSPFRVEHEPGHPHAGADGMLLRPNVHPLSEMTELMAASRAYEANVAALDTAKAMHAAALRILA